MLDLQRHRLKKKIKSVIAWGGKQRHIGVFGTPEQASAAYLSVKKDHDDAKLSGLRADAVNTLFEAARRKALDSLGGFISKERDLPKGVRKRGKYFECGIKWGGKTQHIGTFNTPSCAHGAFVSVEEIRDATNMSGLSADEVNAAFDAARRRAIDSVGGPTSLRVKRGLSSGQNQVIMAYVSEADERGVDVSPSDATIDKLLGKMPISAEDDDIAFVRKRTINIIRYVLKMKRKGLEWNGLELDDAGSVATNATSMSFVFNADTIDEGLMRAVRADDPHPSYDDGWSVDSSVSDYTMVAV